MVGNMETDVNSKMEVVRMLNINELVKNMETAVKDGKNCVAFVRMVDEESCPEVNTPEEVFEAAVKAKVPGVKDLILFDLYSCDADELYNPVEITNGKEQQFMYATAGFVMKYDGVSNKKQSSEIRELIETIPGLGGNKTWKALKPKRKELSIKTEERIREFGAVHGPLLILVDAGDVEFDDCDRDELSGRKNARAVLEDLARRLNGVVVS